MPLFIAEILYPLIYFSMRPICCRIYLVCWTLNNCNSRSPPWTMNKLHRKSFLMIASILPFWGITKLAGVIAMNQLWCHGTHFLFFLKKWLEIPPVSVGVCVLLARGGGDLSSVPWGQEATQCEIPLMTWNKFRKTAATWKRSEMLWNRFSFVFMR